MAARTIARSCLQIPSSPSSSSSAVFSFLQLAPRRQHIHIPSTPLFDFLAPRLQTTTTARSTGTTLQPRQNGGTAPRGGKRGFAYTARRQETRAILNPQKDEDGKDMGIEITPRAASVCFFPPSLYATCNGAQ